MALNLRERFGLNSQSRVVEVASNDGYLLRYFRELGIQVLGVEPARNIAAVARARGIPTIEEFFDTATAADIAHRVGYADLIIGNNVLAHVPAINDFMRVARLMKPAGAAVFEFPYLGELLERGEFDTIYHEHVFYFSLQPSLASRRGRISNFTTPKPMRFTAAPCEFSCGIRACASREFPRLQP